MNQPLNEGVATTRGFERTARLLTGANLRDTSHIQPINSGGLLFSSVHSIVATHEIITAENLLISIDVDRDVAASSGEHFPQSWPDIPAQTVQHIARLLRDGARVVIPTGRPTEVIQRNLFASCEVDALLSHEEKCALRNVEILGCFGLSSAAGVHIPKYKHVPEHELAAMEAAREELLNIFASDPSAVDWSKGQPLYATNSNIFQEVQVKGFSHLEEFTTYIVTLYSGDNPIPESMKTWAHEYAKKHNLLCAIGVDAIEFLPHSAHATKVDALSEYVCKIDTTDLAVIVMGDGGQDADLMQMFASGEAGAHVGRTLSICVENPELFEHIPAPRINVPNARHRHDDLAWRTSSGSQGLEQWDVVGRHLGAMANIRSQAHGRSAQTAMPVSRVIASP